MKNLGYTFYKDYFSKLEILQENNEYKPVFDGNKVSDKLYNTELNNQTTNWINQLFPLNTNRIISCELQTVYPGLLIGSGYIHEIGSKYKDSNNKNLVQNELKLGFYFDYTTGLPLIPGSSVKGVLRSAFEKAVVSYDKDWNIIDCKKLDCSKKEIKKKIKFRASQYIKELLKEITKKDWTDKQISALEQNIFEGKNIEDKDIAVYQRDIFFDAFPVDTNNENGKFLANDYITPHKDPLKNPVPLQFLKILPQVTFQFNFRLHDFTDEDDNVLLSGDQKKELFKQILKDFGIGAKTNVGYGQFSEDPEQAKKEKLARQKADEKARKKEEERKRKEEEERQEKLLQEIKNKEEEEKKRIEEKRQKLEQEIKENGLENILKDCQYLNEISKYLKILKKYQPNKNISDYQEALKICVQNNMKREPKKWKRKDKANWKKIEHWLGKEIADNWFNELT